ncbi:MAG: hypothetical protein QOG64_2748 [Acidimicrobiaceae bacterium]|nr:hypothetical protein [Acidimicrobiaceae bacterium]
MIRGTAAAVLAIGLIATAPACRGGGASSSSTAIPFVGVDPASASPTDRAIAAAQERLRTVPGDQQARLQLAQAFLQKAREVADPSLYAKARGLLDQLRKEQPENPEVFITAGTLALAQHRFADARKLGQRAVELSPRSEGGLGVLVDADNELGQYDEALQVTQRMADIRPNLASLSRVSYARELRGDLPGAIEAMTQAVIAGGANGGENVAYDQVLLGNLLLTTGDPAGAGRSYDDADRSFPGFAAAKAGRAQLLVASGRYDGAAAVLGDLVRVQPLAQYAIAQGDALVAAGRPADADAAYQLVDVISRLYAANGVNIDLEIALFDADHHPGSAAVAKARRALADRPSTLGHDVLSWNLFRAGKVADAAKESALALKLGTNDPQERYHAARIAMAVGDRAAATHHLQVVLAENPRFSAALAGDVVALAGELGLPVPPPPP